LSDFLTVLVSPLLSDVPGGELVNSTENTTAKVVYLELAGKDKGVSAVSASSSIDQHAACEQEFSRSHQWISILEVLSGIDTQLREIQLDLKECLGNNPDPLSWDEALAAEFASLVTGVKADAISDLVDRTEKAIQGINLEISEMLHENSRTRELFSRSRSDARWNPDSPGVKPSLVKSRSQWI